MIPARSLQYPDATPNKNAAFTQIIKKSNWELSVYRCEAVLDHRAEGTTWTWKYSLAICLNLNRTLWLRSSLKTSQSTSTPNLLHRNWVSDRAFFITIGDPDIESMKSLHIIFVYYLDHILVNLEQNRMVRTIDNLKFCFVLFCFFFLMIYHFWQSIDAIMDDTFVTEKKCLMPHY